MKRMGRKLTRTRVAGHQDCGDCHPATKGGKARERRICIAAFNEAKHERDQKAQADAR